MGEIRFSYIERDMLDQYTELLRLAFPDEGVDVLGKRLYENHPQMTARNFYALWDGYTMVATLNIIPQTWSIGGVPLRMAEMGLVATHPRYRGRGLQKRLNAEFDKQTKVEGYHLAGLEGIPYFYRQFGFEYAVPLDENATIPLAKLPYEGSPLFSPLLQSEIPQAMKLLENVQKQYTVYSIRSLREWETQEKTCWVGEHYSTTHALREGGKLKAYVRVETKDKKILLHEHVGVDAKTSPGVAAFLLRLGEEKGATDLVSRESYSEPFSEYLLKLGASRRAAYAWQMKVVDHKRTLETLAPVYEERIEKSPLKGYTGSIPFNFYKVAVSISFKNGKFAGAVEVPAEQKGDILINPQVFPKLLLAYRSLDEVMAEYPDIRIKPEYIPIIATLFPKGEVHIHTCY